MKRNWVKDSQNPYFLTHTVVNWKNAFLNAGINGIILDMFSYYRYQYNIEIYGYVIMPNHLHYIVGFQSKDYRLSQFVRDFKSQISKKVNNRLLLMVNETSFPVDKVFVNNRIKLDEPKQLLKIFSDFGLRHKQQFKLWMDNEKPVILDSEEMGLQRLKYLHENPIRKGWVDSPEDYIYSSVRFYKSGDIFPFRVANLFEG